jgi:hypothetical protein
MSNQNPETEGKNIPTPEAARQHAEESGSRVASCSARPDYPANVRRFVAKWQPEEEARQKAFWKEFRKAANAYSDFRQNSQIKE